MIWPRQCYRCGTMNDHRHPSHSQAHGPGHAHDHGPHGHGGCAHAHSRARSAADIMAQAEETCRQRDVRLTDIRRQVLAALLATHRPMGAYDLIDALAAGGQKRLAPVSIYRALDFSC